MSFAAQLRILVVSIGLCGCTNLAGVSSGHIGCSPDEITIADENPIGFNGLSWTAWCRDEPYTCSGIGHSVSCEPLLRTRDERREEETAQKPEPVRPKKLRAVSIRTAAWSAETLTTGKPRLTKRNDASVVEIPVGGPHSAVCTLLESSPKGGTLVAGMVEELRKRELEITSVLVTSIAVAQEAPVVFVDAPYRHAGEPGLLKVAFHALPEHATLCLHEDSGYRDAFEASATKFFETLDRGAPRATPELVELHRLSLDGVPLGFTYLRTERSARGQRVRSLVSTFLFGREPKLLQFLDHQALETSDAQGRLERSEWLSESNGTKDAEIELTSAGGRAYKYRGEVKGEPVSGTLVTAGAAGLQSDFGTMLRLRRVAKQRAFDFTEQKYLPLLKPDSIITSRVTRSTRDPAGGVRMFDGEHEVTGTLDENGLFTSVKFATGGVLVHSERVFVRGDD